MTIKGNRREDRKKDGRKEENWERKKKGTVSRNSRNDEEFTKL